MHQGTRTRPATAEDFHRLADLAQERGLRVFESSPGVWWATSHSAPFKLHVVTGFSCDCQGFIAHQRCTHHAALLAYLGWLPELETATAAPAGTVPNPSTALLRDCIDCCGCGEQWMRSGYSQRCETCKGAGQVPAPEAVSETVPVALAPSPSAMGDPGRLIWRSTSWTPHFRWARMKSASSFGTAVPSARPPGTCISHSSASSSRPCRARAGLSPVP
jgi:hypothetical protein